MYAQYFCDDYGETIKNETYKESSSLRKTLYSARIPVWISYDMPSKVWDEIRYSNSKTQTNIYKQKNI